MYETMMFALGWVWVTIMAARLPVAYYDSRTYYRAFKAMKYPASVPWIVFARVFLPIILSGPGCLWMDGRQFFARTSALDAYDIAVHLAQMYGPEVEEEEAPEQDLTTFSFHPGVYRKPEDTP